MKYKQTINLLSLFLISLLLLTGCDLSDDEKEVGKVSVKNGNQCAAANSEYSKEVMVSILSPVRKGIFGGKGKRNPVSGIRIILSSVEGSDFKLPAGELVTNKGGYVKFKLGSGNKIGDQYLNISLPDFPKKSKTIRFISGVTISGVEQQGEVGEKLGKPIKLTLTDADGNPIQNVPVHFKISSTPEKKPKAKISSSGNTDKNGVAEAQFKMGNTTGIYTITAEIAAPNGKINIRGIEIKQMGLDIVGLLIVVFGGLAIFIFGMKQMSDGLQLVAGEKMKSVLQFFAKNKYIAVTAGALVTAVIQSSSATTVMVVGFVNAGLLNLTQAIGIVFGANIGTTITAQMVSFKLGGLALPAVIIGLIATMIFKKVEIKGWGQTLLGFGLLFYGMGMMGGELKLLGKFPEFIKLFSYFDCTPVVAGGNMPIGAILGAVGIGAAMTIILQSSSASMGIVLALASGSLINFYTSVPLLLGTNIGTTVTAILASIGANERAKQTAVAHVLFNILGTAGMIILFYIPFPGTSIPCFLYVINSITNGDVFDGGINVVRHIAMAHTFFNFFTVLMFIPLIGLIAKICNMVIKVEDEKSIKLQYLEPHLLDTPSIAIDQTILSIRYMVKEAWSMVQSAIDDNFLKGKINEKIMDELIIREEKVDELQEDISHYLVQLTQRELTKSQSELIPLLMHCNNDAEKIADHTNNILRLTKRLQKASSGLSEQAKDELKGMWTILADQSDHVISCLNSTDKSEIKFALKGEKRIKELAKKLEKRHIKRAIEGNCDVIIGIIYIEILAELEAIGDGFANIAERAEDVQKHYVNLG